MKYLNYITWFFALFTQAKSFKDNPILGNKLLNRLGLHVFRILCAHAMTHWRWFLLRGRATKEERKHYQEDGFLIKKDYLPSEHFQALYNEVLQINEPIREMQQGDAITRRIFLDDDTLARLPACSHMLQSDTFLNRIRYCSSKLSRPFMHIQSIKNHYIQGIADPQRTLHSDTFHPTVKAWFFLEEVTLDNGPFSYVPGSHKLSLRRLAWEYQKSLEASHESNHYSAKGSFRVEAEDMDKLQLAPAKSFTVPANTLIIANTHGFHCRGAALKKSSRLEFWLSSRSNPFSPLPSIDVAWKRKIEQGVLKNRFRKIDERNIAGSRWAIINSKKIHE